MQKACPASRDILESPGPLSLPHHMKGSLKRCYATTARTAPQPFPFAVAFHVPHLTRALRGRHHLPNLRRNGGSETQAILPKSHRLSEEEPGFASCLMPIWGSLH